VARQSEVKVRISGDSKSSEAAAKRSEGAIKRLGATIKRNLAVAMVGATAAAYALVRAFKAVIRAANTQEDAVNRVTTALGALNQATPENVQAFKDFAAALQKTSTVGDEVILNMAALALSFTNSAEQAQKLTRVALDFSKGAGISFEEALRRLGRSLGGAVGDIANFAPEIRNLTAAQIEAGVQIDILGEKYAGFAEKAARTFSGRLAQLGNALSDVAERVGELATKNEQAGGTIERLTAFVQANEGELARLAETVGGFVTETIGGLADKFTKLGTAIGWLIAKGLELGGAYDKVEISQAALEATAAKLGVTVDQARAHLEGAILPLHTIETGSDAAATSVENLDTKLDNLGTDTVALADNFKNATDAAIGLGNALGVVTSIELEAEIAKINEALVESKEKLDENSSEYIRLEAIAAEKIESLRARILNLRDGLGDLSAAASASVSGWSDYTAGVDAARAATDRFAASARQGAAAAGAAAGLTPNAIPSIGGATSSFSAIAGGTIVSSSASYERLPQTVEQAAMGVYFTAGGGSPFGYYSDGRVRGGGWLTV
jgi:methyl-accepting chemotaxis protein